MSISLRKINNVEVIPPKLTMRKDPRPVLGERLFEEPYCNIGIIAKKKSGKTIVVSQIIKEKADKDTIVLAFCATVLKDPTWIAIRKWCDAKGIRFEGHSTLKEGKIDYLAELLKKLGDEEEEDLDTDSEEEDMFESKKKDKKGGVKEKVHARYQQDVYGRDVRNEDSDSEYSDTDDEDDMFGQTEPPPRDLFLKRNRESNVGNKAKYLAPQFIIVFDDFSQELKSPSVISFLKRNRH